MPKFTENYYDILGISPNASQEEIKSAYKRQAFRWHPDKNPEKLEEAAEKFKKIREAYECLSDPYERKKYNLFCSFTIITSEDEENKHKQQAETEEQLIAEINKQFIIVDKLAAELDALFREFNKFFEIGDYKSCEEIKEQVEFNRGQLIKEYRILDHVQKVVEGLLHESKSASVKSMASSLNIKLGQIKKYIKNKLPNIELCKDTLAHTIFGSSTLSRNSFYNESKVSSQLWWWPKKFNHHNFVKCKIEPEKKKEPLKLIIESQERLDKQYIDYVRDKQKQYQQAVEEACECYNNAVKSNGYDAYAAASYNSYLEKITLNNIEVEKKVRELQNKKSSSSFVIKKALGYLFYPFGGFVLVNKVNHELKKLDEDIASENKKMAPFFGPAEWKNKPGNILSKEEWLMQPGVQFKSSLDFAQYNNELIKQGWQPLKEWQQTQTRSIQEEVDRVRAGYLAAKEHNKQLHWQATKKMFYGAGIAYVITSLHQVGQLVGVELPVVEAPSQAPDLRNDSSFRPPNSPRCARC